MASTTSGSGEGDRGCYSERLQIRQALLVSAKVYAWRLALACQRTADIPPEFSGLSCGPECAFGVLVENILYNIL